MLLKRLLNSQFTRFILTGGTTAGLDLIITIGMTDFLGIYYIISSIVGFTAGSILNYYLSIRFVFKQGRFNVILEFSLFIVFLLLGVALSSLFLFILADLLGLHYKISKLITIFLITMFNFITKKKIIFLK